MGESTLKVLVLDDEESVRQSLCDYFDDYGFRVLAAKSGEAALELLNSETPDAAIVDIRMGGTSGEDFIREVYPMLPECVFVICTGSPEYGLPKDFTALRQVSSSVFKKPVTDLDSLLEEVLNMIALLRGDAGDE